ncbi:MAG: TonB-dependent receptor [Tannerella sp.]|jgi:TonB-linked SusC/RagA family outer membrane protein|nr:TonB-dependent receptor [Tannerella sp.]
MENSQKKERQSVGRLLSGLMFTALFSLATIVAFAQSKTVTGIILDETGEPVTGANVIVVGTTNGIITDMDGNFRLSNVAESAKIRVSYIGYLSQEVSVAGKTHLQIQLQEDTQALDEVIVIGYGVQKKSDVTGAVAVVSSKDLTMRPVSNAMEALQGKAAGVDVTSNQRPGELGKIRVRGMRSLDDDLNDPLYVVDGIVLSSGGIEALNPKDIESINVLKDASSTAIYGSRGANGVILVTTKRGKTGALNLNYSGTVSFEKIHDLQPSMSASEYITWRRWAYHNANPEAFAPGNQPNKEQDMSIFASSDPAALDNVMKGWASGTWDPSKVTNTDWADLASQTGISQEHTVSAGGGTDKMKSFFSIGYLNNEGTQKGQSYERYNLTATVDITPVNWFTLGGSVNAAWSNQYYGYSRTGQSSTSGPTEIYNAAKAIPNWTTPYDENGDIIQSPGGINGVYTVIDEWKYSKDDRQVLRLLGNGYANFNIGEMWKPLDGLNYKTSFGSDMRFHRQGIYLDQNSATRGGGTNYARWDYDRRFCWVLDNVISYNKTIDIHKFDVTLLHSASQYNAETARMSEENVPKASYLWNNMGAVSVTDASAKVSISTGLAEKALVSYGYRLNYSLMEKYLLTVSGRYDGASQLAEGNKWAFFPSAALGWRMEQESFLSDVDWLHQLKLRAGVGVTGNSAIDAYATLGNIRSNYAPFGGQSDVLFYVPNEPYYWSDNVKMANSQLGWEKTTQWNFAVDFSILKGRIGGSIDLYMSNTDDLIMDMKIPTITGYSSTMANVGKTKNHGVDVSLRFIPVDARDFTWTSNLNAAWQKDEIVELAYGKNDMVDNSWFIGQSIRVYYGYESDGLWQESDAAEMAKFNEKGEKFTAGMVKPVDKNGDYIMNEEDRVVLGNRMPRWTLGWSNSFRYKNVELNIEMNGRMGYMVSTGGEAQGAVSNQRTINYWRPDNTNADYQKPIYTGTPGSSLDPYSGLLGFKDASYIKMRNISLGYYLPNKICNRIGLNNLKVYGQLRNPGNIYSSIDFLDLDLGESVSFYNRGVTLGLEISF